MLYKKRLPIIRVVSKSTCAIATVAGHCAKYGLLPCCPAVQLDLSNDGLAVAGSSPRPPPEPR
eukprot:COSAG06_NODE_41409_length_391_cov_12.606164_2_plen_62_part_01